jgi:hypothetical protein
MAKCSRPVGAAPIFLAFIAATVFSCAGTAAWAQAKSVPGAIGAAPAGPLAADSARGLLKWIYSLRSQSGRRVLSGQDIGYADGPQGYYDWVFALHERTGKWPAIIGTDYDRQCPPRRVFPGNCCSQCVPPFGTIASYAFVPIYDL